MAKRKKSKGMNAAPSAPSSGGGHLSTSIDDAQNGFIINVSGEDKKGGYFSKRFISPTRGGALVIASQHLAGSKKGGKKLGKSKRIALKKS